VLQRNILDDGDGDGYDFELRKNRSTWTDLVIRILLQCAAMQRLKPECVNLDQNDDDVETPPFPTPRFM
jgi:hypothetical protein